MLVISAGRVAGLASRGDEAVTTSRLHRLSKEVSLQIQLYEEIGLEFKTHQGIQSFRNRIAAYNNFSNLKGKTFSKSQRISNLCFTFISTWKPKTSKVSHLS